MSGKAPAAGIAANPDDREPVASASPLTDFSNDATTVQFSVDGPGPLSVEVNGQIRPALLLFIDSAAVEDVRFEDLRVEDARDKLVDFRVGLSIYSQDCPERYHRRNPQRKPTGAGQWVPWECLTADEQAVARQNRGAIRNVRLADIQLLENAPPRSFIVNSGSELSGVTFQNLRQGDRVFASSEDFGLSVDSAAEVRFADVAPPR